MNQSRTTALITEQRSTAALMSQIRVLQQGYGAGGHSILPTPKTTHAGDACSNGTKLACASEMASKTCQFNQEVGHVNPNREGETLFLTLFFLLKCQNKALPNSPELSSEKEKVWINKPPHFAHVSLLFAQYSLVIINFCAQLLWHITCKHRFHNYPCLCQSFMIVNFSYILEVKFWNQ